MDLYNQLIERQTKIAIIGLGYVGMPLAVAFQEKLDVIGFDINKEKINKYLLGVDVTNEVGSEILRKTSVRFTSDESKLSEAKFFIIAVPTPISTDKTPNLQPVIQSTKIIGKYLSKGTIVVYESTVYPGVTEEICAPLLEEISGLKCGTDFKIGYSPERINPGDKVHTLKTIKKVVSGMDQITSDTVAKVYELIIEAGVHKTTTIKVAEASKVVENAQRDINIAFMNELAMIFDKMGIDTNEVIEAMNTKWNALKFYPGLVGGHCIGVDPYYFIYKAEELGYHSQIIMAGRKINDDMGKFVAEATIKQLIMADKKVKGAKIAVLGISFKENCGDTRNSKVIDIINYLQEYGIEIIVIDPIADKSEVKYEYNINLNMITDMNEVDGIIIAVAHEEFRKIDLEEYEKYYKTGEKILIDVKGIINKQKAIKKGFRYWSL